MYALVGVLVLSVHVRIFMHCANETCGSHIAKGMMTLLHLDLIYASVGKTCCNNACNHVIKRWRNEKNRHHSEIHSPSPPLEADIIILTNGMRGLY